jgi:putative transposase
MGIARSTYYEASSAEPEDITLIAAISDICSEFEAYGWRRVRAALQPKVRRRFVATTDSDHSGPIFPDMAKNMELSDRDQLWVAELTYVAIPSGSAYVAVILDAWSRRVVGYAIGRSIDARLALSALRAAIWSRRPPPGCVHHSDRGSQYAAEAYRELLATHGLVGSMGRRGNP